MAMRQSSVMYFLLCGLASATSVQAATFVVTRGDDPVPGGCLAGDCSLREAVQASETTPEGDTIQLGNGLYNITRGELVVTGSVTLAGVGAEATRLAGVGASSRIGGGTFSELTLRDLQLATETSSSLIVLGGSLALDNVTMPLDGNEVRFDAGNVSGILRVERARLAGALLCGGENAACIVRDSDVAVIAASGDAATLDVERVNIVGFPNVNSVGLFLFNGGRTRVRDSLIRGHGSPLALQSETADVRFERTRVIENRAPMTASGDGTITFDDVEFSDNIVADGNLDEPAVLFAEGGVAWRFNRVLFEGNRGGGGGNLDGAVVALAAGANVVMTNVTFANNTFRAGVVGGIGHTIGVRAGSSEPTILWMFHATMRRASTLTASTVGSVLSIRGSAANVRVINSLVDGTCAISEGGAMFQAVGNIESTGFTCGMSTTTNQLGVPPNVLRLGSLTNNGGFTRTFLPVVGSLLLGNASPTWCPFTFGIDQRRFVRPTTWVGCDVGAVEAGALSDLLFDDNFE